MPLLGAHMSVAGGFHNAVDAAAEHGMECVQIFTKNNNQWQARPMDPESVDLFRRRLEETGIRLPCAHASYLINLGSPKDDLWQKSITAMTIELERAEVLGLAGVVLHPGSYTTSSEEDGIERIAEALDVVLLSTDGLEVEVWLENTAGQGTNLGHRFEQLEAIISRLADSSRVGICLDSCHLFAAGYALESPEEYSQTMTEFDETVGRDRLRAWHLNDSKREFGSRVDRHETIGEGHLGLEPFRHILNDPLSDELPMYLETPKGDRDDRTLDEINLETLRSLSR
ncbi:MAG: deoxyribonuclease IV [Planctomycetota bacterium]|nr:deoxyribonuclease IV [Planctomycetota bacterium]